MERAAPPWQSAYPPGLSADAALAAFAATSIIREGAARWEDKPAIDFRGRTVSYAELDRLSDAAARRLIGLGVRPGDKVALLLPNTPWHPIAFFGVLKAGAVVVHVSPLDAPRVVEHKLGDSGARMLVTTDLDGLAEKAEAFVAKGLIERVVVGEDAVWGSVNGIPTLANTPSSGPSGHLLPGGEKRERGVAAGASSPLGERVARAEPEPGEGENNAQKPSGMHSAEANPIPIGKGTVLLDSRHCEAGADHPDNTPSPPRSARHLSPASEGEDGRQVSRPAHPLPSRSGGEVSRRSRDGEGGAVVRWGELGDENTGVPLPSPSVDDLALLQYTGGTTGMPKAAMLTHRNLSAAVSSYDLWFTAQGLSRPGEERILLYLPLFHIYGLTTVLLRGLANGHTILLRSRFDPVAALDEIEAGATAFPGVPTMWIAIASTSGFNERDLSSLHHAASGGAPMPVEVARRFTDKTGLELLGGWGMSETAPAGTNLPPGRPDKLGSIGVPLPGVSVSVVALDDPRRVLGPGETGELAIKGPNVTAGYHNRPDENASSFIDGWFLTGDIGHMDEDGFFFIVDRKKDMIISGGFNVYPQMIEQAIYEHPDVEEVLVIGVPDDYRGEAAKAFVKLRVGAPQLSLEALRAFLKGRVGPHEMPAALDIRDALPRTAVGKLSKLELKQEEAARRAAALAS